VIGYSLTSIFAAISWQEQFTFFGEITMMYAFVQDQHTELDSFIVLAHWNNSPRIVMRLHSDTIKWFPAKQSLLLFLSAACLAEKQQMPLLLCLVGLTRPRLEPTHYRTRGEMLFNTFNRLYWLYLDIRIYTMFYCT